MSFPMILWNLPCELQCIDHICFTNVFSFHFKPWLIYNFFSPIYHIYLFYFNFILTGICANCTVINGCSICWKWQFWNCIEMWYKSQPDPTIYKLYMSLNWGSIIQISYTVFQYSGGQFKLEYWIWRLILQELWVDDISSSRPADQVERDHLWLGKPHALCLWLPGNQVRLADELWQHH